MNDLDRWVNLEGPEPRGVRELFDAVREDPERQPDLEMTPELEAELDRRFFAAMDEEDRRWAAEQKQKQKKQPKPALAVAALCLLVFCLLSAGFAGAIAVASAIRDTEQRATSVAKERAEPARARQSPAPPPSGSPAEPARGPAPPVRRP